MIATDRVRFNMVELPIANMIIPSRQVNVTPSSVGNVSECTRSTVIMIGRSGQRRRATFRTTVTDAFIPLPQPKDSDATVATTPTTATVRPPRTPLEGCPTVGRGGVEVLFKPAYVASIPPGFTGVC